MNIEQVVEERLALIELFKQTFIQEIEPTIGRWPRRGLVQGAIFKRHNLARTGPLMRAVNEAIVSLGYTPVIYYGKPCFTKR